VKQRRNDDAVRDTLAAVTAIAADPRPHRRPAAPPAVRAYPTLQEIPQPLETDFGTYDETALI
jgi:methylmalonyl-CoA mutase N-terminal domain/subunit